MKQQTKPKPIRHIRLQRRVVVPPHQHPPVWLRLLCTFVAAALTFAILSGQRLSKKVLIAASVGAFLHILHPALEALWERVVDRLAQRRWSQKWVWVLTLGGVMMAAVLVVVVSKQWAHA